MVVKHAAEVAQVIAAAKEQAPLFAQQAKQGLPSRLQTQAQTMASPTSHGDMLTGQKLQGQIVADAGQDSSLSRAGVEAINKTDSAAAAEQLTSTSTRAAVAAATAQQASNADGQQAQQANKSAAGDLNAEPPQAQHAQQAIAQPPPVKRRAVKPITMAKGSLSFLPKRPALAAPSALAVPATISPSVVSSQTTVPSQQQSELSQNPVYETQTGASLSQALPAVTSTSLLPGQASALEASDAPSVTPASNIAGPAAASTAASRQLPGPSVISKDHSAAAQDQAGSEAAAQIQTAAVTDSPHGNQPAAAASQPSGMASMFGGNMTKPRTLQPRGRAVGSALFGRPAAAGAEGAQEADADAVQRLRAQFTLPFAMAPAEDQIAGRSCTCGWCLISGTVC